MVSVGTVVDDKRARVVLAVSVLSLPGTLATLGGVIDVPWWLILSSVPLIPIAVLGYWRLSQVEDDERTSSEVGVQSVGPFRLSTDSDDAAAVAELLAANYEQMNQQAMYRDRLLIRANYFSLAVIAVLVNIFLRSPVHLRPTVAVVGTVSGYGFLLATSSYKGARDAVNDRIRALERHPEVGRYLSTVEAYDTRERAEISKRSLSSYFVGLQFAVTAGWCLVYLGYVLYLGWPPA